MKMVVIIPFIFISAYLLDKACRWLENKGLLYYRHKKPEPGLTSQFLLELQTVLNPSTRHVIEMKQNTVKYIRHESDVPGKELI